MGTGTRVWSSSTSADDGATVVAADGPGTGVPAPRVYGQACKVVGNLQDNSHRRPIGNLSSKVSGNLLRVREVDIVIQEGNQLGTSQEDRARITRGVQHGQETTVGPHP